LLNGTIYYLEGDAINGSLSMSSSIPLFGNFVSGGKNAKKVYKALESVPGGNKIVSNAADKVDDVADNANAIAQKGGVNLFKWGQPQNKLDGWKTGDCMLYLPDQGSVRANWKQNSGRIRTEMKKEKPIFDTHIDPLTGEQISTSGFLNAERNLLESRGWIYDPTNGAYMPPATIKIIE
jgi:hypothetical protein